MQIRWSKTGFTALALLASVSAWAQTTERVSLSSSGSQGNNASFSLAISSDGRFVVFLSAAVDLVPGDTNAGTDVFVRDRLDGTTERVSVSSNGVQANDHCEQYLSVSADGRFVAFVTRASSLVAGDTNSKMDVFVRDRLTSTTERASVDSSAVQADGDCFNATLSADGRFMSFASFATNLVSGDTNGCADIFVRDRLAGTTERVSTEPSGAQGNGDSWRNSISADGRFVVFVSRASNLVPGDANASEDLFVRDRLTGTIERVNLASSGAESQAGSCCAPSITEDGRFVLFASTASNLVPGDTNGGFDIFVRDLVAATTERVNVGPAGVEADQCVSGYGYPCNSISADGRYVSFFSNATNLVLGDTNSTPDVFVRDRQAGTTERVSVDSTGAQGDDGSYYCEMSADGRHVAFDSLAANLVPGDTNSRSDVFVHDRFPQPSPFCWGDGKPMLCPCFNLGSTGRGCENSALSGGALLYATGVARLSADSLVFTSYGELPTSLSIVLQGTSAVSPLGFGDGLRCIGGALKRLYVKNATNGVLLAPAAGDLSVSARSTALNDPIQAGSTRYYQVYYRDPSTSFCPAPLGSTYNISSALPIQWAP